jgi:protein-S-isoprenylcysteine O-methyltransferase Ste14
VIIYALMHLRSSLSIIPEVRRLVIGGPYRLVRHPLYAALYIEYARRTRRVVPFIW